MSDLPRIEAGARMPTHAGILQQDMIARRNAEQSSAALLRAIQSYFANGGRA